MSLLLCAVCLAHCPQCLPFLICNSASQHTLRLPAFPQALIKYSVRSIGHSSGQWNCFNSKAGIGRPATSVLGANVANSVPPSLAQTSMWDHVQRNMPPPSSGQKYQPPVLPPAVSCPRSYEQVQCGLIFRREDWWGSQFFWNVGFHVPNHTVSI